MRTWFVALQDKFWPLSALIFGPWHAPLMLLAVSRLTAKTVIGAYISAHYNTIKSVLVVSFSLYFMLALMIWIVGKRRPAAGAVDESGDTPPQQVPGLSTRQIIGWGLLGMVVLPALVFMSALTHPAYFVETFDHIFRLDPGMNSGFIWLMSISTLVMIPTMVIWLVWMWRAWSRMDDSQAQAESWSYEYD